MPNILKSVSGAVGDKNWTPFYTATAPTIVRSVIATGDSNLNSIDAHLGIRANGSDTPLASGIAVAIGTSVNMLAGTLVLNAGESIIGRTNAGGSMFKLGPNAPIVGAIAAVVANANTIIVTGVNGIWRSVNEGETWAQVSTIKATGFAHLAYIGTSWFAYDSATNALRSTDDGLTWSAQAVTNAPTLACNTTGNIVRAGSTWAGLFSSTVMSTTTDGITWTQQTALPGTVGALCWSGTNYIAGRNNGLPEIFRSTNGAVWATVNTGVSTPTTQLGSLASNGLGVVVLFVGVGRVSTDHGETWSTFDGLASHSRITWTGSAFLAIGSNNKFVSPSGAQSTWTSRQDSLVSTAGYVAVLPNKVLYIFPSTSFAFFAISESRGLPGIYGLHMTASMMEVS